MDGYISFMVHWSGWDCGSYGRDDLNSGPGVKHSSRTLCEIWRHQKLPESRKTSSEVAELHKMSSGVPEPRVIASLMQ